MTIPQTLGSNIAILACEPSGVPAPETYARVSATDAFSSTLNALSALRLPEAAMACAALRSSVQLAVIAAHAATGNTAAQWLEQECAEFAPSLRLPELPFERLQTLQPNANLRAQPLAAAKPLDFTLAKLAARPVFLGHTAGPSILFAMPAAALPGVAAAGPAALARIPLAEAAVIASTASAPYVKPTVSLPGFAIPAARSDDFDSAEEQIKTPALCEKFIPAPAVDPAQTYLRTSFTPAIWCPVDLPGFAIAAATSEDLDFAEGLIGTPTLWGKFMPAPVADPAETYVRMAFAPAMWRAVEMPSFAIAAASSEDLDTLEGLIGTPALCEQFMPAPAAEPAETYVRMAFAPGDPHAIAMPAFSIAAASSEDLDFAEGLIGTPALCEKFMPAQAAEPAETYVRMAFAPGDPRAIAMPTFSIAAASSEDLDAAEGLVGTPALYERFMPALVAAAAETYVRMALAPAMWRALEVPGFAIAAASSEELDFAEGLVGTPALCEQFMPVAAAEPAETYVRMAFAPGDPRAIAMPAFSIAAASSEDLDAAEGLVGTPALCERFMPAPAAAAAETYVRMASSDELPAAIAVHAPAFAGFAMPGRSIEVAPFAPAAEAQPLEMLLPLAASVEPKEPEIAAVRLPQMAAVAAAIQPARQPGFAAAAMAAPHASPIEAVFAARTAPAHIAYVPAALALPAAGMLGPAVASVKPQVAASSQVAPAGALTPEQGKLAHVAFTTNETVELPGLSRLRPTNDEAVKRYDEPLEPACEVPAPEPVEAFRVSASAVIPAMRARPLAHPVLGLAGILEHGAAGFERTTWRAVEPPAAVVQSPAVLEPLTNIPVSAPAQQPLVGVAGLPIPGFVPLEFFCQHAMGVPVRSLDWAQRRMSAALPRFAVRPIFGRLEDLAPQKQTPKKPAFAEIFTMPEAQRTNPRTGRHQALKAMAAGLMLMAVLWFGAHAVRIPKELSAGNRAGYSTDGGSSGAPAESAPAIASASRPSRTAPASGSTGVLAKVRSAVAERASAEVGETFREGMEAWGSKSKSWAEGWTRSSEGWVRPGGLALFQPAQTFKDYRLEFFGQIESKSMDWAVRAKDQQNYHAMKFAVMEPGLRPVLAMIHYPVVNGKRGKPVQTPLNVMVHNNTAYHFAIDVKGNKVTTSIEGQEVDSWTDDTLVAGGVGFFSEAGERARLYWMKVSKNQDFLGRICSYLSSGSNGVTTAELWNPEVPIPAPQRKAPVREDVTLAAAEPGLRNFSSPQRDRISDNRRNLAWSS